MKSFPLQRISTSEMVQTCIHVHPKLDFVDPHVHVEDLAPESWYVVKAPSLTLVMADGTTRVFMSGSQFQTPSMVRT